MPWDTLKELLKFFGGTLLHMVVWGGLAALGAYFYMEMSP